MNFIIDVGVGKSVENYLRENNHNVKCIREIDPRMTDVDILNIAIQEHRIIVTMDNDFGNLIFKNLKGNSGIILLRMNEAKADEKRKVIAHIINNYHDDLNDSFCVYKNDKIRVRKYSEK